MKWKNKKVFVTGAGGFIGSHLCERLVQLGANVTALVKYNSRGFRGFLEESQADIRSAIRIVFGDIRDESTFRLYLKDIEIVFHLAANPGIPYSFVQPRDVFDTNTLGSFNLLNAARDQTPEKIILASSAETYGDSKYLPIDEQHPQFPKSPYAASKAAMEKLAWSFYYAYELPITIVRLFNNYGPRQSARAVTPTIITQILSNSEVRIGALHPRRDFTLVLDTVRAFTKVAEFEESGEVFNIGSGISISVKDIIDKVMMITGKSDVKIVTDESRIRPGQSEVQALKANYQHLKEKTGWQPQFSYEEGLKLTIDWIAKNIGSYRPTQYSV